MVPWTLFPGPARARPRQRARPCPVRGRGAWQVQTRRVSPGSTGRPNPGLATFRSTQSCQIKTVAQSDFLVFGDSSVPKGNRWTFLHRGHVWNNQERRWQPQLSSAGASGGPNVGTVGGPEPTRTADGVRLNITGPRPAGSMGGLFILNGTSYLCQIMSLSVALGEKLPQMRGQRMKAGLARGVSRADMIQMPGLNSSLKTCILGPNKFRHRICLLCVFFSCIGTK